jgi:hypothetical protein
MLFFESNKKIENTNFVFNSKIIVLYKSIRNKKAQFKTSINNKDWV